MKKYQVVLLVIGLAISSCGNNGQNKGASTPIDSTNVNGTPPATYGGDNPTKDTNLINADDTGTKANNIHNEGTYRK